ncbi:class I SAM-dependent methyltransferase [Hyphococcus flavus]|uniref:Class I SAM-dependent methyltransferase n=1 Tax=Hyphococcus flavus TaxID=1866326 RepID=A0AAE9ZC25_9PROT|nr:class I SAM-dependent methyltransferase [Hyphococcus flavus]WDI31576.1 class I SAM-dependent methyltransferase [Hyphococcus flavus]
MKQKLIDFISAAWLAAGSKILRTVAADFPNMPRSAAALDRLNIVLQNRTYYRPFITREDLRAPLRDARNLPGVTLDIDAQMALLAALEPFMGEIADLPVTPPDDLSFGYYNGCYGPGDAEILYGMIRKLKPKRIIEIGSGHSTKLAVKALKANGGGGHTCIEPYEAPWLDRLGVETVRKKAESLDPAYFDQLSEGDILFIDSSHIIRPQGDVLFEYLEVLPALAPGVIVHVHDIFTPFDYHEDWIIDRGLLWNEQYLLEALLSGGGFDIMLSANWLSRTRTDEMAAILPGFANHLDAEPSSFWVRKKG